MPKTLNITVTPSAPQILGFAVLLVDATQKFTTLSHDPTVQTADDFQGDGSGNFTASVPNFNSGTSFQMQVVITVSAPAVSAAAVVTLDGKSPSSPASPQATAAAPLALGGNNVFHSPVVSVTP